MKGTGHGPVIVLIEFMKSRAGAEPTFFAYVYENRVLSEELPLDIAVYRYRYPIGLAVISWLRRTWKLLAIFVAAALQFQFVLNQHHLVGHLHALEFTVGGILIRHFKYP